MHRKLIEAALFMASRPLGIREISKITGIASLGEIERMLGEIRDDYEKAGKAIEIVSEPEGWSMQVKSEFLPKVAHLTRYSDLADGHKRTLALVVYKEPVKQSEIIKIQGNKAYSYIKSLQKKGLINSEKIGRTKLIRLTQEFERYFGEDKDRIREKVMAGVSRKGLPGEGKAVDVEQAEQMDEDAFEKLMESKKRVSEKRDDVSE